MASSLAGLGMTFQKPEYLTEPVTLDDDDESSTFSLITVDTKDTVYKEVCTDFENADMTVLKIEKLINPHLWKRYVTERDLMVQQRSTIDTDFKLNEKYLYHGTSALKSQICEEGLDSRMSKQGCFGKGIYFSDYPRKCIKYAEKGESTDSFILLARVILGTPKVFPNGEKDKSLVREPEKSSPYKGYRFYDSVEGCPVNHKEFVVYESRRALVEYIITFSKKIRSKTLPANPASNKLSTDKHQESYDDVYSDFSDSDTEMHRIPDVFHGSKDSHKRSNEYDLGSSEDEGNYQNAADNDGDQKNQRQTPAESAEDLLERKRNEFQRKTGEMDEYRIDHYLLRGNLNVSEAVKLYQERPADGELVFEPDSKLPDMLEQMLQPAAKKPDHPTPGSQAWKNLPDDSKEAIIKGLVEDFLSVTGLTEDNEYVRMRLATVNYNLDHAVLAHYEEM